MVWSIKYKWRIGILLFVVISLLITGCTIESKKEQVQESQWPNAVFYEIFVRSFYDTDGDGIGDLKGVTEKLDYLKELGIEGIWLMPINPSPSYHKYDVTDYYEIDPEYGTLEDFKTLLTEAQARDIKVIMDLVVNHTSNQHTWFKEAKASKDNPFRNWYIWADENTNTKEIGEWGQQVWHSFGMDKYYGTFWNGMPDLNFDNPEVRAEMIKIGKYWLEMGVDGFRLDAAKHIFQDKEKEKNYAWWQEFRKEMESTKKDVFLVGEVWAPVSVVGPYLQEALNSTFNFDLSTKILSTVKQEDDAGIASSLKQVREYYTKMDEAYIDSIFLTNHDMNRVMTELKGNVDQAKMAASILFTLPGSPFIYYGEELGMMGAKPDEYIREPFLWSKDNRNGGIRWIDSRHNKDTSPLDVQIPEESSIYNHYKKLIQARRSNEILVLGEIDRSKIKEKGILAYKRILGENSLLVVHNVTSAAKNFLLPDEEAFYTKLIFTSNQQAKISKKGEKLNIELAPYSTVIISQK